MLRFLTKTVRSQRGSVVFYFLSSRRRTNSGACAKHAVLQREAAVARSTEAVERAQVQLHDQQLPGRSAATLVGLASQQGASLARAQSHHCARPYCQHRHYFDSRLLQSGRKSRGRLINVAWCNVLLLCNFGPNLTLIAICKAALYFCNFYMLLYRICLHLILNIIDHIQVRTSFGHGTSLRNMCL